MLQTLRITLFYASTVLAELPSWLYIGSNPRGGEPVSTESGTGLGGLSQTRDGAHPRSGNIPMQSILDETQDVELLLATAVTAAGYVIGAAVFLAAFL
jgi:hypothetical protein